ncbi:MAG: N-acetylmuramic acid 6-phosphate etherase [Nitrospirota bacterium]
MLPYPMSTEDIDPRFADIDLFSVEEIIGIMNDEDLHVVKAVKDAKDSISMATKDAINTIVSGGSIVYVGAGTSGRLGMLDASEMQPTFNLPTNIIRAIIAGGEKAITTAVEGAEDDEDAGRKAVSEIKEKDMLLGITASGSTPFVISALREGKRRGAKCWLLTCSNKEYDFPDGVIRVFVGPEIIAGSTRLKAGTATKIVLNMISTITMIKLGRVYKGYMVDVVPSSKKLKVRALRMIQDTTGCGYEDAKAFLEKSGGSAKIAIVMYIKKLSYEDAIDLLEKMGGSLRKALGVR